MIRLHFVTWLEVFGVLTGLISLGSIGMLVTPQGNPSRPLLPLLENQPERVIDDARLGYQVDTCVRDISPRTVLSESASGASEFVVLEGAPVTECFPGLAEFIESDRSESLSGSGRSFPDESDAAPGADIQTSVRVIPPIVPPATSPQDSFVSTSTSVNTTEKPSPASDVEIAPTPSGGATVSSPSGGKILPPIDHFDACRTRLFGTKIPATLTEEEQKAFERCLLEAPTP